MSNPNEDREDPGVTTDDEDVTTWDEGASHVEKVRAERNRERKRRQELEKEISELREFRESVEEKKQREEADFQALLEKKEQKIKHLHTQVQELEGTVESINRGQREAVFLDEVSAKVGIQNKNLLKSVLRSVAESREGFDLAPEEVTATDVRSAVNAIKEFAPELITTRDVGGANGTPGTNRKNKAKGEDPGVSDMEQLVRATARAYSGRPDS